MHDQLQRLRATHPQACMAAVMLMIVAATSIHLCPYSVSTSVCLFVASVFFGPGLSIGWNISSTTAALIIAASVPLLIRYRHEFLSAARS